MWPQAVFAENRFQQRGRGHEKKFDLTNALGRCVVFRSLLEFRFDLEHNLFDDTLSDKTEGLIGARGYPVVLAVALEKGANRLLPDKRGFTPPFALLCNCIAMSKSRTNHCFRQ